VTAILEVDRIIWSEENFIEVVDHRSTHLDSIPSAEMAPENGAWMR
jgi:hypothetical protein